MDSNIPMYLAGAAHPNKEAALRIVERLIREEKRLVTSAEVFQELLHRYAAIGRRDGIQTAWEALSELCDETFPIEAEDVREARGILLAQKKLSARDALHVAIMKRHGVRAVLTFDKGFDRVSGLERIP